MSDLNGTMRNHYRATAEVLLLSGAMFSWGEARRNIAPGESYTYSFTTSNRPVLVAGLTVDVLDSTSLIATLYRGGATTGGLQLPDPTGQNHTVTVQLPTATNTLFGGGTITVPGTAFSRRDVAGGRREVLSTAAGSGVVLAPNTLYYLTLENRGADTGTTDTSMFLATLV